MEEKNRSIIDGFHQFINLSAISKVDFFQLVEF